jgi:hypothetical protein
MEEIAVCSQSCADAWVNPLQRILGGTESARRIADRVQTGIDGWADFAVYGQFE